MAVTVSGKQLSKLEQLERLRSEIPPPPQVKTRQSYKS